MRNARKKTVLMGGKTDYSKHAEEFKGCIEELNKWSKVEIISCSYYEENRIVRNIC